MEQKDHWTSSNGGNFNDLLSPDLSKVTKTFISKVTKAFSFGHE
jgi:hypothetical protein